MESYDHTVLINLKPDSTKANATVYDYDNICFTEHYTCSNLRQSRVLTLTLESFFGRLGLSFGSAQWCDVRIPNGEDVAECQFILRFQLSTGIILLEDKSELGTRISNGVDSQDDRLLLGTIHPILESMTISFGDQDRFRYRLMLKDCFSVRGKFFQAYARSINLMQPLLLARVGPIEAPLNAVNTNLLHIHKKKFGATSTCIRLCDGNVFALKHIPHGVAQEHHTASFSMAHIRYVSRPQQRCLCIEEFHLNSSNHSLP